VQQANLGRVGSCADRGEGGLAALAAAVIIVARQDADGRERGYLAAPGPAQHWLRAVGAHWLRDILGASDAQVDALLAGLPRMDSDPSGCVQ